MERLEALPADGEVHVLPVVEWPRLRDDSFSRTAELIRVRPGGGCSPRALDRHLGLSSGRL